MGCVVPLLTGVPFLGFLQKGCIGPINTGVTVMLPAPQQSRDVILSGPLGDGGIFSIMLGR